jgi:hypothetical protein
MYTKSRLPAWTISRSRRVALAPSLRSASHAAHLVSGALNPTSLAFGCLWRTRIVSPSITRISVESIGSADAVHERARNITRNNLRTLTVSAVTSSLLSPSLFSPFPASYKSCIADLASLLMEHYQTGWGQSFLPVLKKLLCIFRCHRVAQCVLQELGV